MITDASTLRLSCRSKVGVLLGTFSYRSKDGFPNLHIPSCFEIGKKTREGKKTSVPIMMMYIPDYATEFQSCLKCIKKICISKFANIPKCGLGKF